MPHIKSTEAMQGCIEACTGCHAVCIEMIQHCLEKGGRHVAAEHIRLLEDCAEICRLSADFMLRGSPLHIETCAVCADICEKCAESCDRMSDDEDMRRCAEACRQCAESCREMAGGTRISHAA